MSEILREALERVRDDLREAEAKVEQLRKAEIELTKPVGPTSRLSSGLDLAGLTITEVAEAVLKGLGKPLLSQELADALLAGGVQIKRNNPAGSIYQTLKYSSKRFKRPLGDARWGMAEWGKEMWD